MSFSNYLEKLAASGCEVTIIEVASHKGKVRIRVKPDTKAIAKRKELLEAITRCYERSFEILGRRLNRK